MFMNEIESKNFKEIEGKWQKFWEEHPELYHAVDNDKTKDKKYVLVEFPYPSGSGLHIGHTFSFTGADVYARLKRMQGYNVLFPMGWDAFGLPTENYAIKTKQKPQKVTKDNTDKFRSQMKALAFSFDWAREVNTTDPNYYKWTQWIFIQLYKKGLAYKKEMPINWCPSCKIGLANEEVVNGRCERCGAEVERRTISQWVVKITEYADQLAEGLKDTDFIEKVKQAQINWIGKSEGAKVKFKIKDLDQELEVFTTRPDTLFGATFMVVAPEHPLVSEILNRDEIFSSSRPSSDVKSDSDDSGRKTLSLHQNIKEIKMYVENARKKSDMERTELAKEKTGVFSGLYAINPVTGKEIPIWISDFVLSTYGTGAIMSVPAHDERDYDFAKKFGLEIKQVLAPVFKITEGKDAIRDDKPTTKRNTVYVFVKHWSEDKYLCLDWKQFGWHSGIIGGVNDGEDWVEAAKREVREETGYLNIELEKEIGVEVHNNFFAGHKDENRYAVGQGYVFKLIDGEKTETKEEEVKNHELVWIEAKEMEKFLNLPVFKYYWEVLKSGRACFTDDGVLINSELLNGLYKQEAIEKITKWLEEKGIGEETSSYHLRDWIFSRQHYWGEPIPMIHCDEHGWVPVPENQLPIVLPEVEQYEPTDTGESPLSTISNWVDTVCPICGKPAKRETDTMPNWAGSDWYFLRYIDPFNDTVIADMEKMKYWMPVDLYVGGDEHNTLHLLYSRFIYKFLYDLGAVPQGIPEPYYKRLSHGVILGPDNQRMSKSRGNVIVPETVAEKYGVDVVRMYLMFMGPFDATMAWNENTLMGVKRFLDRFKIYVEDQIKQKSSNSASNATVDVSMNKLIKKVTDDTDNFKYNTAIAKMMETLNVLAVSKTGYISDKYLKDLIIMIAPYAPYTAEELWSKARGEKDEISVHIAKWPVVEEKYLVEDKIKVAVAINGKVRDEIEINTDDKEKQVEIIQLAKGTEKIKSWLLDKKIVKEIYIPGKMVNFVVTDN